MQIEELVKLSSQKVRGNSDLMAIYIDAFKNTFGKVPNCAGCTFSADFTKLKKVVLKQIPIQKTRKMADTTFKLKKKLGKIHSYKKNGRTIHFYDTNMTEEIAIEYLTYGTPEQIENRKELFAVLPKLSEKEIEVKGAVVVSDEFVTIGENKYTLEQTLSLLEKAGLNTRATTVKGIQKFIDNLSEEELSKLK